MSKHKQAQHNQSRSTKLLSKTSDTDLEDTTQLPTNSNAPHTISARHLLSPSDAMHLQRVLGNRAMGQLLAVKKGAAIHRPAYIGTPIYGQPPIQRLSKTVNIPNGTASLIYAMGGQVKSSNDHNLSNNYYQEMSGFTGTGTVRLTLSAGMEEPFEFGFIANVLSSTRTAYYDSSNRTKATVKIDSQTLDGDGSSPPFAEDPTEAPKTAGTHTLDLEYRDNPLLIFPRKDPNAEDEGNTLVMIAGTDIHKVWLVVGDPTTSGIIILDSQAFQVTWSATINNQTNKAQVTGKTALVIQAGNPVLDGELANDAGAESEGTW